MRPEESPEDERHEEVHRQKEGKKGRAPLPEVTEERVGVRRKRLLAKLVAYVSDTHEYKVDNRAIEAPISEVKQWKVETCFFGDPAVPEDWCIGDADDNN